MDEFMYCSTFDKSMIKTEKTGYLYCFSNPSMPGILKVGVTLRTPKDRLKEANDSDTWRPPTPYCLEFAKNVIYPKEKEKILHQLLEKYTKRIHPRREFFQTSKEDVHLFFDLLDGNDWTDTDTESTVNPIVPTSVQQDTDLDSPISNEPETRQTIRPTIRQMTPRNDLRNDLRNDPRNDPRIIPRRSLSPRCPKMRTSPIEVIPSKRVSMNKNRPDTLKECFKRDTLVHHKKKGIDEYAMVCANDGFVYICDEQMTTKSLSFRSLNAFTNHNYTERNKREGSDRTTRNNAYIELVYKNDEGTWISCDEVVSNQILTQVKSYP
jgi:hypothetical protein